MKALSFTLIFLVLLTLMTFPVLAAAKEAPQDVYLTVEPDASEGPLTALHEAIVSIFGKYTPKTQTVTRHLADGTEVTYTEYVPGLAGVDFEWLFSVAVFALVIFCVFKLIGGLLKL